MTPKFVEIIPPFHRQGNCIPSAAIRWHDFGRLRRRRMTACGYKRRFKPAPERDRSGPVSRRSVPAGSPSFLGVRERLDFRMSPSTVGGSFQSLSMQSGAAARCIRHFGEAESEPVFLLIVDRHYFRSGCVSARARGRVPAHDRAVGRRQISSRQRGTNNMRCLDRSSPLPWDIRLRVPVACRNFQAVCSQMNRRRCRGECLLYSQPRTFPRLAFHDGS